MFTMMTILLFKAT